MKNEKGEVVYRDITDADGQIKDIKLTPGKYTFTEILAPSRFALNPQTFQFIVNEDSTVTRDTELYDELTRIEILKVDEENTRLTGVEFTMFDKDGNSVMTAISDENRLVKFEEFGYGDYIIKEIKTLEGYKLSGEVIELNVDGTYVNLVEPVEFVKYKTPKT